MFDFAIIIKIKIVDSIRGRLKKWRCSIIKNIKLNPSKKIITGHIKWWMRLQGLLVTPNIFSLPRISLLKSNTYIENPSINRVKFVSMGIIL